MCPSIYNSIKEYESNSLLKTVPIIMFIKQALEVVCVLNMEIS